MADLNITPDAQSNRILNAISGKIGRAIDLIGNKTGNVLPELNISEQLEYAGSRSQTPEQRVTTRTDQGKAIAGADTQVARDLGLNFTYDTNAGIPSNKPAYNIPELGTAAQKASSGMSGSFTMGEIDALGLPKDQLWNGNTVNIGGQEYVVKDNGDGTRSFEAKSSGGGGDQILDRDAVQNAINKAGGAGVLNDIFGGDAAGDLLNEYSNKVRGNVDALASEIEAAARDAANREYSDVLEALGVQRGEVNRLGKQQKGDIQEDLATGKQMLTERSDKEKGEIEEQRGQFKKEAQQAKEQLAAGWRAMSLEIQRIMRSRGIQDSGFAVGKETELLRDFNKGLGKIAEKSQAAMQDFGDAIVETVRYYNQKKTELETNATRAMRDVDNWVRQRVQAIQAQENTALSNKLAQIRDALVQGRQLRVNVENQIAQQELNFGMWLQQARISYQTAVATAAKGSVASAQNNIKDAKAVQDLLAKMLDNGTAQFMKADDGSYKIVGQIPNANGEYETVEAPATPTGAYNFAINAGQSVNRVTGNTDQYGNLIGNANPGLNVTNQYLGAYGFDPLSSPNYQQEEENNGGFLSSITNLFN